MVIVTLTWMEKEGGNTGERARGYLDRNGGMVAFGNTDKWEGR